VYLTSKPEYPVILARIHDGARFLDAGCGFGQIVRQLVFNGVPARNVLGVDQSLACIDLGYDLFQDRGLLESRFLAGDLLDPSDSTLATLDGQFSIIHAGSLFHLFNWRDQVALGSRLVRFIKPDATAPMVIGKQVGNFEPIRPSNPEDGGLGASEHDLSTLQVLWNTIGEATGTRWRVDGEMTPVEDPTDANRANIWFVVTKAH